MRTDAQLLAAAGSDAHAFRELYDRYADRIHRFHVGRTRDRDTALELTAETFAQAWFSRHRFENLANGSAAPWLYAIARNVLVVSVRRSRLEHGARERLGILAALDRPQATDQPSEGWLDGLDEAFGELSPDERDAVRLRVIDDLSYEDVGRAAGTSPGAARVRVHRALAALRTRLLNPKEATR
jgi:RNA polymerase sigma factor (sigma-70 family)